MNPPKYVHCLYASILHFTSLLHTNSKHYKFCWRANGLHKHSRALTTCLLPFLCTVPYSCKLVTCYGLARPHAVVQTLCSLYGYWQVRTRRHTKQSTVHQYVSQQSHCPSGTTRMYNWILPDTHTHTHEQMYMQMLSEISHMWPNLTKPVFHTHPIIHLSTPVTLW